MGSGFELLSFLVLDLGFRVLGSQGLRFVGVPFMVLRGLWAGAWNGVVGGFRVKGLGMFVVEGFGL